MYSNRIIVETPPQASFVNLDTGYQVTLAANWDEYQNRNFRGRPQLNNPDGWIEVFGVNGERRAYEQATGAIVEDYLTILAQRTPIIVDNPCRLNNSNSLSGLGYYVVYAEQQVRLFNNGNLLRVLRENLFTKDLNQLAFSEDCRYFAAAIAHTDAAIFNTVVWDTHTGRELIFNDARHVPHPFKFLTNDKALIQTRKGGFLWNLSTDERTLLTEGVQVDSGWRSTTIRNFYKTEVVQGTLWGVTINEPTGLTIYDLNTGQQRAFYDSGGTELISYQHLDEQWIAVYSQGNNRSASGMRIGLWNTATGVGHYLVPGIRPKWADLLALSDNQRYFIYAFDGAHYELSFIRVWDLHSLNSDGSPNTITHAEFFQTWSRLRPAQLHDSVLTVGERHYDIFTGDMLYIEDEVPVYAANNGVDTPNSDCNHGNQIVRYNNEYYVIDPDTGEQLAFLGGVGRNQSIGFTANGCYIMHTGRYRQLDQLWDAITFEPIELTFQYVYLLDFAPNGHSALIHARLQDAQSYARTYYLWDIPSNRLLELVADV